MDKRTEKLKEQFSKATGTLPEVAKAFIWGLCKELEASQGIFYVAKTREDGVHILTMVASYAYHLPETSKLEFEFGEGLAGQVAKEGKLINLSTVPEGYLTILSGLGQSSPRSLCIVPLKKNEAVFAVLELASFKKFTQEDVELLQDLSGVAEEKIKNLL